MYLGLVIRMSLTVDEIRRFQEKRRKEFEELVGTDPEKARQVALHNLQSAGIVDEDGNLTDIYSDDLGRTTPLAFTRP